MNELLQVRGAREHNLRGVDLDLPRGALIVFSGVSGSGKSSLAFDTLYAEASRRFVEALAPGLRNRFGPMRKPAFDWIAGLTPAIGVSQRGGGGPGPRSTVGTLTEVHDLLRVVWSRAGEQHCPRCDRRIHTLTPDGIARALVALPEGARLTLGAPLVRGRAIKPGVLHEMLDGARRAGFTRVRLDGVVVGLEEVPTVDARAPHDLDVVVDRVKVAPDKLDRLHDSVATALTAGRGTVSAWWESPAGSGEDTWGTRPRCSACELDLPEPAPRLFSFNTPVGACPRCEGLGVVHSVDPEAIVRADRTLADGAVEGGPKVRAAALARGIPLDRTWRELGWEARDFLLSGGDDWEGALALVARRAARSDAPDRLRALLVEAGCPDCAGARLSPAARAVRVEGRSLPTLAALELPEAREALAATPRDPVTGPVLDELDRRLAFLARAGLGHLSLDRAGDTLSTGELQRVRLGATAGNQLSGVLYVLDEPTAGLHADDTRALLVLLRELRDAGNTLLVVEHDQDVVAAADVVVDFGPGPGREGGTIVFHGPPDELLRADTPTARWLAGVERLPAPRPVPDGAALVVRNARGHTLRGVDARFPLRCLVAVTGVSGSGKSSLVEDTLGRALAAKLGAAATPPLPHDGLDGADAITRLVRSQAGGPARSPRSNAATFTGVWDAVRSLYARTPEARVRGWGRERFSLHAPGGRCEACGGEGVQRVDLHLLPELQVTCDVCDGRRFEASTLAVTFRGASIADVLEMPVRQARALFANQRAIAGPLAVLDELGLGYLPLGQPGHTLSGGEAQRLGLARELGRPGDIPGTLYLLDEPSVGLHPADVAVLHAALRRLVDAGGSVVLVEHDPALVAACDHVLVLGPGAGHAGGTLVYAGPPPAP